MLELVKKFNELVKDSIDGPSCIDPNICKGDCCFINIDIPKQLAQLYCDKGWAKPEFFKRGDVFTFEIVADLKKLKCVFFDKELNGCGIHLTGMKPPQCWVYPTGLDKETQKTACKRASGWNITNPEKTEKANTLLKEYVESAKAEAQNENTKDALLKRMEPLEHEDISKIRISSISGVRDTWDRFIFVYDEGYNMSLRGVCESLECGNEFFGCNKSCQAIKDKIFDFLKDRVPKYVEKEGFKEEYSFFELKKIKG